MNLTAVIARGELLRYGRGNASYTARFEDKLAQLIGVRRALTVNSGTNALVTAMAAAGIGPGDEVLVPAYTWVATALAPMAVGAVPVLVNINETLTIDPQDIERKITPHTRAIVPVHMQNVVCDMDAIMAIARRHKLLVIEDACQAVGVRYKGRRVGGIGDLGAFSFNHHKNITSGEGGAVVTNDERFFVRARMFHDPGAFIRAHEPTQEPLFSGLNCRVSELTGAVLEAQIGRLDPLLDTLCDRYAGMAAIFADQPHCRPSPHNDPVNAVALSVLFDDPQEARLFGQARGANRLIDTGRHVFTNWEAVLCKRSFDERLNPHRWAHREITYQPEDYQVTLDILSRTCRVSLGPQYPAPVMMWHKRALRAALLPQATKPVVSPA
ncbi:MAG: DegT/DnrJ/EryC1/StrS family aminotransferase [Burkholderiaceae bacterium]